MHTHSQIPKILFQTSKVKPPKVVIKRNRSRTSFEWSYLHFNDQQVIDYLSSNPINDFPQLVQKYLSFKAGAHRADLFRYFFLYLNGGVYLDSDVELRADINNIIYSHQFVTVLSTLFPGTVFNGFLCARPRHPLIFMALKHLYASSQEDLAANYFHTCSFVYQLVYQSPPELGVALYKEAWYTDRCLQATDQDGQTLLLHYWIDKEVPCFPSLFYLSYFLRLELWALARHYLVKTFAFIATALYVQR